jgi:hypothetical protein
MLPFQTLRQKSRPAVAVRAIKMDIVSYDKLSEVDALREAWDHLSTRELCFVPSFSELLDRLKAGGERFRFLVAVRDKTIVAIACFIYHNATKNFQIANRKLFGLPVKEISLFGASILGEADENAIQEMLRLLLAESGFDLINLRDVVIGSSLYNAVTKLHGGGVIVRNAKRNDSVRWLIRLPKSFDEYMTALRSTTRRRVARDYRRLKKHSPDFFVITSPADVERFLRDAEQVSRLTYQWSNGVRVCNDEQTRRKFARLAEVGHFRGYLSYVKGTPCAFTWGQMNQHRVFAPQVTGFDPRFSKLSPGTALWMRAIRDLIENTDCEVLDFGGVGEDDGGYKSRFGNVRLDGAWLQVARWNRPYALFVTMLDQGFNLSKNLASSLIGYDRRRKRLRMIRH